MKTGILAQQSGKENPTNLLSNGDFENWSAGTAVAPDGWSVTGGGSAPAIAREASTIKLGTYSAKFTATDTAVAYIRANAFIATKGAAYWIGRTLTLGCWVWCATGSRAYILLGDDTTSSSSSYHTGGSTWEWLSVSHTIAAASTIIVVDLRIVGGAVAAYFDGAICVEGESAFAFADKPGNVVAPATNTDSKIPQWNGANTKTLKDGLAVGTSAGNLVQLDGSAKLPAVDGSALTGITNTNTSNVVFCWAGHKTGTDRGFTVDSSSLTVALLGINSGNESYKDIISTKFKKISTISTITYYVEIWSNQFGSGQNYYANVKVDIGGLSANNNNTGAGAWEWVTNTIDVSSLTNGTVYDLTVNLKSKQAFSSDRTLVANIVLFGS